MLLLMLMFGLLVLLFPLAAEMKVLMDYDEETEEDTADGNGEKSPAAKKVE